MKKITRRSFLAVCGAAAAAAALTACGGSASSASTTASSVASAASSTAEKAAGTLSGNVATGGSTSMKNVIAALTEGFAEVEPGVTVSYDPTGSGAGITGATDKTLDIGLSSRALTEDEIAGGITETVVAKDEAPRPETTLEALSKLPPIFTPDNTVTAGNAPGTNDGASAVVIMSREKAQALGAPILATLKGYAQASREARYIATVPGLAIQNLMEKTGLKLEDVELMEVNEAFAAVPLVSCLGILGMSQEEMDEKVNVNGGAVAVGHPIGATGARILMTLIYELRRSGKKTGVAAICSGMAQGDAVWIEAE